MEIPVEIHSDEKGYFDRECPSENCLYQFKISMEDWKNKVSDDEVHCPMCGCIDNADRWWTQQQLEAMREIAVSWAMGYIQDELGKAFKKLERSTRNNKYCRITYKPGKKITFINNPIGQMDEWETDITCNQCGTRYSVIGSAFFCPCCGYNSASDSFGESLDSIEKMLDSLEGMKALLTDSYGRDKAETMTRSMLESSIGDIVSAFQKFACCKYEELSQKTGRVNDFQIIEKGSNLFRQVTGYDYSTWLNGSDLNVMSIMFQRRHLLEHNNGMVDQRYIEKSGDCSYSEGQRIVVRKEDAYNLLRIIKKLGMGLKNLQKEV